MFKNIYIHIILRDIPFTYLWGSNILYEKEKMCVTLVKFGTLSVAKARFIMQSRKSNVVQKVACG